jgi:Ig-like domain CHU_C associated
MRKALAEFEVSPFFLYRLHMRALLGICAASLLLLFPAALQAQMCTTAPAPVISAPTTVCINGPLTASVTPESDPATTYEWSWKPSPGCPSYDCYPYSYSGRLTPSLTIQPFQPINSTHVLAFWVSIKVTNSCGSTTATKYISVEKNPDASITAGAEFAPNNQHSAHVPQPADALTETGTIANTSTYSWTVHNATPTGPLNESTVFFITPASGNVDLSVTVVNACGTVSSSLSVPVSTCHPAEFSQHPASTSIALGSSTTLSAAATGDAPITYEWYRGNWGDRTHPLGNGLSVTVSPASTSNYYVEAMNACGGGLSNIATVTVTGTGCTNPSITTQPQSQTIANGQFAHLAVVAAGTGNHYTWYYGQPGDVSHAFTPDSATLDPQPSHTMTFWVRVNNGCATVDSNAAVVTVTNPCDPPAITSQPQSTSITLGDTAVLTVVAAGTANHYAWYGGSMGDASTPAGTDSATLSVSPTVTSDYWVRVFNSCLGFDDSGTVTVDPNPALSATARVTVESVACVLAPVVASPAEQFVPPGQTAALSVLYPGSVQGIQWFEGERGDESHPIAGATFARFQTPPVMSRAAYWARVATPCGVVSSNTAHVAPALTSKHRGSRH